MMERVKNAGNLPNEKWILEKDDGICPVQWAVTVCKQAHAECCGRGVFCRDGLKELYLIAEDITENKGTIDDVELLQSLCDQVMLGADCEAAYEGARLMKLSLDTYYDDWTAHVLRKRCKSGQCTAFPKPGGAIMGMDLGGGARRRRAPAAAPDAAETVAPAATRRRRGGAPAVEEGRSAPVAAEPVFEVPEQEETAPASRPAAPVVTPATEGMRRRRRTGGVIEIIND